MYTSKNENFSEQELKINITKNKKEIHFILLLNLFRFLTLILLGHLVCCGSRVLFIFLFKKKDFFLNNLFF